VKFVEMVPETNGPVPIEYPMPAVIAVAPDGPDGAPKLTVTGTLKLLTTRAPEFTGVERPALLMLVGAVHAALRLTDMV
jgi:hypothetical protein